MSDVDFSTIRREYPGEPLDEATADADPLALFADWFGRIRGREPEPTGMTLATVDAQARPSARMLLLKGVDSGGFVFYTNYDSRKGREIAVAGVASLLFYWPSVHRQVRVRGAVERVTTAESDAYFRSRPYESQLAAHASQQSHVLASRQTLEALFDAARARYAEGAVPRPATWGGYRLIPDEFEFWQGRPNRLHDRLQYALEADGAWSRTRLAP